jgi:hypothetical protein
MTINFNDDFPRYPWERRQGDNRRDWVKPHRQNYTSDEAPYSYSEFFHWRDDCIKPAGPSDIHATSPKGTESAYSDRLWQWNGKAAEKARKEVPGRMDQWTRAQASKWLTIYWDKPVEALALAEGCNVGNGYPYFIVWFRFIDK